MVQLKDFDAVTLSNLLDFMYTSMICISEENAQDILIGANLLLLQKVKGDLCSIPKVYDMNGEDLSNFLLSNHY